MSVLQKRKRLRNFLIIVVALALLVFVFNVLQHNKAENNPETLRDHGFFAQLKEPVMVAHRGASGNYPESTFPAFEAALEKGAQVLEMDVWMSADGHIMVIHDESVDRTTNGEGMVSELTLEEIKDLDAAFNFAPERDYPYRGEGVEVPTLNEVMERFPNVELLVEVKDKEVEAIREVAEVIKRHEAQDRVLVASFSDTTINNFRDIMPGVATCGGIRESLTFYFLAHLGMAGWIDWEFDGLFLMPTYGPLPVFTDTMVSAARASGLHIYIWTINDEEEMKELLEAGVNGVITDYPALLYQVRNEFLERYNEDT